MGKHQARLEEKLSGKLSELCSRYGWLGEVKPVTLSRRIMSGARDVNSKPICICGRTCSMMPKKMSTPARWAENSCLYIR